MEWIKKIIEKYTKDGVVDVNAAMTEINAEFPKNAVPKDKFNDVSNQLKEANKSMETLKGGNKDNEALQKEIDDYKAKVASLEKDASDKDKMVKVKGAFEKAGATDAEYAIFKAGGLDKFELDKDGNIKDLENLVKQTKENAPTFFKEVDPSKKDDPKVIENKLPGGNPADPAKTLNDQVAAALGL